MIKKAVVEIGKTPSVLTGKKSTRIVNNEALDKKSKLKKDTNVKLAMEKLILK